MLAQIKALALSPILPPLEALLAPDGTSGAAIRSLCGMVSLSLPSQLNRIRRQSDLAAALQFVTIETAGGNQAVAMLEGWAIAVWAAGLQTARLSPEKQEAVALLKQHAYSAIARAFSQPEMVTESPTAFAVPAPEVSSVLAAFDTIQQGFDELKEHVVGMDQRIVLLEQDRLGRRMGSGNRLSAAQVGQLFMQLVLLREQTGIAVEDAEKRLAGQFGVAHIIDIDASEWATLNHAILALFHR